MNTIFSKAINFLVIAVIMLGAGFVTTPVKAAGVIRCVGAVPCYTTIQAAITAAGAGDTINVLAGTYDTASTIVVDIGVIISGPIGGGAIVRGIDSLLSVFEIAANNVVIQNLVITVTSAGTFNTPPG
jgi:hypothetical protein